MKDDRPTNPWELQEDDDENSQWLLQESEQQELDHLQLETPDQTNPDWQPVEYIKPRPKSYSWILPSIITIALLVVVGYIAWVAIPRIFNQSQPATPELPEQIATPAVAGAETPAAETPAAAPAQQDAPTTAPSPTPEPPTPLPTPAPPTPIPPTPAPQLAEREMASVASPYGVNLRRSPNQDGEIIQLLLSQDEFYPVVSRGGDGWTQIFASDSPLAIGQPISGVLGWVSTEYIVITTKLMPIQLLETLDAYIATLILPTPEPPPTVVLLPTVTSAPEEAPSQPGAAVTVTVTISTPNGLNARAQPNVDAAVVTLLENNRTLPALARSADGQWIQVQLADGQQAWLFAEFLVINGDSAILPVVGETGTGGAEAPIAGTVAVTSTTPAPLAVTLPAGAPSVTIAVVGGVNARLTPDLGGEVLAIVPEGSVLPASGRSPDDQWVQVKLPDGRAGWMFKEAVQASPEVAALPIVQASAPGTVTPTEPISPTGALTTTGVTGVTSPTATLPADTGVSVTIRPILLAVYSTPGADQIHISSVTSGAVLPAVGRTSDNAWIQIRSENGVLGWVSANGVTLSGPVETLPVVP
jgi:SH3-like domain-containing protein